MLKIQMEIRRSVARLPVYLFDPLVVYGERGLIKISRYRDKAGIGSLIQVFRLAYSYRWGLARKLFLLLPILSTSSQPSFRVE